MASSPLALAPYRSSAACPECAALKAQVETLKTQFRLREALPQKHFCPSQAGASFPRCIACGHSNGTADWRVRACCGFKKNWLGREKRLECPKSPHLHRICPQCGADILERIEGLTTAT